jgi:hypothetical protein
MPGDDDWDRLMREAAEALENARTDSDLNSKAGHHHRGDYFSLRTGVSMGGGQKQPTAAYNSDVNNEILRRLNSMECFQRIAGFSTSELCPKFLQ